MKSLRQIFIRAEGRFWEARRSNLHPSIFQHDYLALVSLLRDIEGGIALVRRKSKKKQFDIIDIGCGEKPYKELFDPIANKYIGVDVVPYADIIAHAEKIPVPDHSFDLALHFQVFEHLEDPQRSVQEMKRVLRKDGYVIASTHGIWNYHPFPHDYYRWTDEGLKKLFYDFSFVSITPNLTSYATIIQLINIELYSFACRHLILKLPCYLFIALLNILGRLLMPYGQNHFSINYLIVAKI